QMVLGMATVIRDPLKLAAKLRGKLVAGSELLLGEETRFNTLREVNFLFGVEERHLADLLEVVLDGVRSGTRRHHLLCRSVVVFAGDDKASAVVGLCLCVLCFGGLFGDLRVLSHFSGLVKVTRLRSLRVFCLGSLLGA